VLLLLTTPTIFETCYGRTSSSPRCSAASCWRAASCGTCRPPSSPSPRYRRCTRIRSGRRGTMRLQPPSHTVAASVKYGHSPHTHTVAGVGPRGRPVPGAAARASAALSPAPHARLAAGVRGHGFLHRPTDGARDLHRPRAAGAAGQARRAPVAASALAAAGDAFTESPHARATAPRGIPAAGRLGGAAGAQRRVIPVRGQATAHTVLRAGAAPAPCVGRHPMLRSQLPGRVPQGQRAPLLRQRAAAGGPLSPSRLGLRLPPRRCPRLPPRPRCGRRRCGGGGGVGDDGVGRRRWCRRGVDRRRRRRRPAARRAASCRTALGRCVIPDGRQ